MTTFETYEGPNTSARYWKDVLERVLATFVQAFAGAYVASGVFDLGGVIDMAAGQKAAFAGIVAVLALVKALAAKRIGSPNTASLLPADDDTPRA